MIANPEVADIFRKRAKVGQTTLFLSQKLIKNLLSIYIPFLLFNLQICLYMKLKNLFL